MRYYVQYDDERLIVVGAVFSNVEIIEGVEVTEEEYNKLLTEMRTKSYFENMLYRGEITINDVPTEWQEEIQRRVDERIAAEGEADEQDISAEEALDIILGGEA